MTTTIENNSITSLLLLLEGESLPKSKVLDVSNMVAEKTLEIIEGNEQANALFIAEKKLIGERGNSKENYLIRDDVTVNEILESYFRGIIEKNNFRRLSDSYSISELMLMLGTFAHLMEARNKGFEDARATSIKIRVQKLLNRFRRKKADNQGEDLNFLENIVATTKASEERMISYMQDQVTVITKTILEKMGSNFGLATRRQLEGICTSSYELCSMGTALSHYFKERDTQFPPIHTDVALMDACGERSPKLYSVLEPVTESPMEKKKGTK